MTDDELRDLLRSMGDGAPSADTLRAAAARATAAEVPPAARFWVAGELKVRVKKNRARAHRLEGQYAQAAFAQSHWDEALLEALTDGS